jgi:beta-galactosidase
MQHHLRVWKDINRSLKLISFDHTKEKGEILVNTKLEFINGKCESGILYRIDNSGKISVTCDFRKAGSLPEIPRFGMRVQLPVEFDHMKWYGKGPHENYIDRNMSAFVGIYESKVIDQFIPYIYPQENGYKTEVRWSAFSNEKGEGVLITGNDPLGIGASHNSIEDYDPEFRHSYEIKKKDFVELNIDFKQMGVGGDNSWGYKPHPEYRLLKDYYSYGFTIEPIKNVSSEKTIQAEK